MSGQQRTQIALTGLQWTLGLVILIEAILFVIPILASYWLPSPSSTPAEDDTEADGDADAPA